MENRDLRRQIDRDFLMMVLKLIKDCTESEKQAPEMINEVRECVRLIHDSSF